MKPKLIILTDLWGNINSEWIQFYAINLENKFEVKLYDCCEIAEIDSYNKTEKEIHSEFIEIGISKASQNLLKLEIGEINILAFSVGGIIAWNSVKEGLNIINLKAISSTRLRNEISKPNCNLKLYYGENDDSRPKIEWFKNQKIEHEIIRNAEHNIYKDFDFAKKICQNINQNW